LDLLVNGYKSEKYMVLNCAWFVFLMLSKCSYVFNYSLESVVMYVGQVTLFFTNDHFRLAHITDVCNYLENTLFDLLTKCALKGWRCVSYSSERYI